MKITITTAHGSTHLEEDVVACIVGDNGCLQYVMRDKRAVIYAPGHWFSVRSTPDESDAALEQKPGLLTRLDS